MLTLFETGINTHNFKKGKVTTNWKNCNILGVSSVTLTKRFENQVKIDVSRKHTGY